MGMLKRRGDGGGTDFLERGERSRARLAHGSKRGQRVRRCVSALALSVPPCCRHRVRFARGLHWAVSSQIAASYPELVPFLPPPPSPPSCHLSGRNARAASVSGGTACVAEPGPFLSALSLSGDEQMEQPSSAGPAPACRAGGEEGASPSCTGLSSSPPLQAAWLSSWREPLRAAAPC